MTDVIETIKKYIPELITEGSVPDIIGNLIDTHCDEDEMDYEDKKIFFAAVDGTLYKIEVGQNYCDVFFKDLDEVARIYKNNENEYAFRDNELVKVYGQSVKPAINWEYDEDYSVEFE